MKRTLLLTVVAGALTAVLMPARQVHALQERPCRFQWDENREKNLPASNSSFWPWGEAIITKKVRLSEYQRLIRMGSVPARGPQNRAPLDPPSRDRLRPVLELSRPKPGPVLRKRRRESSATRACEVQREVGESIRRPNSRARMRCLLKKPGSDPGFPSRRDRRRPKKRFILTEKSGG
jgi:hypothetical protein